jgi:hypothetical protein
MKSRKKGKVLIKKKASSDDCSECHDPGEGDSTHVIRGKAKLLEAPYDSE